MQNLCQLVKYSLISSLNWIHVMSDLALQVNMTPLTVEDRLIIKTVQTEKKLNRWKKCPASFQQDSENGI